MKVVPMLSELKAVKKTKRIPMHKDPIYMAELRRSFIEDHNKKIKAKQAK